MASGGRAHGSRPRARAVSVVVPFPRRESGGRLDLVRLVPSGRSILLAFALLTCALLAWLAARETGMFAVRTLDVEGAPPAVAVAVHKTLADDTGTSLLKLDLAAAQRAVQKLPTVAGVTFDRAFPHTLRIIVVPERPVAIVRRGPIRSSCRPAAASSPGPVDTAIRSWRGSGSSETFTWRPAASPKGIS